MSVLADRPTTDSELQIHVPAYSRQALLDEALALRLPIAVRSLTPQVTVEGPIEVYNDDGAVVYEINHWVNRCAISVRFRLGEVKHMYHYPDRTSGPTITIWLD